MKEKNSLNNETLLRKFAKGKNTEAKETGVQNCVIYTRVSSKEQMDTNQSLEWQKKYCDDYARKNSLVIKGYFGGTYESAKSDERKEFNRMLKFVKASKEKISYILVYSLDRFSRTGDSAIYIAGELKKVGINIMAVTQPIDTNSHAGALQQNIQFIFSKYDNDLRRQKTIDGMREKLLRGEWIGNAPTGYEFVKGAPTQTIIINEKGELIKEAFEYRAIGMTIEQIIERLKVRGLTVPKQTLAEIFKNPFYCGKMSHNLLNGELVKGKHPALISEELFLKANELKTTAGFKVNKANDNLPLKVFVKDADTGYPYTGYLVKKKGLYYYKVNKIGIGINRSVKIMHDKFQEFLKKYSVENLHMEPLKAHLQYVWDFCTEANTSEKKVLSLQINAIDEEFFTLRKNHAIGKVAFDIYQEFSVIFAKQKEDLVKAYEKLDQKLSNPKELIDFTSRLACNLPSAWACGDYYQKQTFQNTLFPQGVVYDVKIEHYRTEKINSVIELTSELSNDSGEIKKPVLSNFEDKTGAVQWCYMASYLTPNANAVSQGGMYIHRFGKKAGAYNLLNQTANAYNQDMGITSVYAPYDVYSGLEIDPEVSSSTLQDVVFYLQTLKAPIQRKQNDPDVVAGKNLFIQTGCEKCHKQTLKTGYSPIEGLSNKEFHPYTDLLLHDMGAGLDDGYTEGNAKSYEWRTPALWGLGLSKNSQGGQYYLLHDGRASSIEQAIYLHGGEAQGSNNVYQSLSISDKQNLIKFLESL